VTEDTTSPISPSSIKLNFNMMKKSQSMVSSSSSSKDSSVGSVIARDKSLQSFTQALIHVDPDADATANGASLKKTDQENIYETVDNGGHKSIELVDIGPAKKSDSSYTFQSYDFSSRSSTLSSNAPSQHVNSTRPIMGTRVLLPRNNRIADLEFSDISGGNNSSAYCSGDELSSLSGYESIEGNIDNIYPPNTGPGNKKKPDLNMTSFSNPNYLCPDAKTILERKQQKNKFDETILPPTTTTVAQLTRDESHQNFAAALNSPAESLISDYQDFHARLNHDLVEMNPSERLLSCQKPAVKITSFSQVKLRPKTTPVLPRRKPRPVSSGNVELSSNKHYSSNPTSVTPPPRPSALSDDEFKHSEQGGKNQLSLLMYVIGGRVGQVTVFNGPISLWKLDLTKTF